MRIAVVAPSSRPSEEAARRVTAIAERLHPGLEVYFHPQCFLAHNHFAGTDAERGAALVEVANDPGFDAIWFRAAALAPVSPAEAALAASGRRRAAKRGSCYSDAGIGSPPLPSGFPIIASLGRCRQDALARGGEAAVAPRSDWLVAARPAAWNTASRSADSHAAFNMTFSLLGTPRPPVSPGHVCSRGAFRAYVRIDLSLFHIMSRHRSPHRAHAGARSEVPAQRSRLREDRTASPVRCARAGSPYLVRADIGR